MTYHSAEDALAALDRQTREATERARAAAAFRQGVDRMRGTAGVGGLRVTVDPTGSLVGLELPRDLGHRNGESLARQILQAVRDAHAEVARQVETAAAETFGPDSGAARQLRAELDRRAELIAQDVPPGEVLR
ncbi:YbaB/EbfC family nucleoid-associated protein [Nocardioides sp. Iso805N]|uniref:YbaB/EbfC family nucleoid-associated protein n=1 Tax=Nocardioides sp. Iso805N TaxID=1283287 RepID=UPI00037F10E4|nr:YbaB/EbfC family nucleoid-associated protein [Nocardioides sp. Iso805N]